MPPETNVWISVDHCIFMAMALSKDCSSRFWISPLINKGHFWFLCRIFAWNMYILILAEMPSRNNGGGLFGIKFHLACLQKPYVFGVVAAAPLLRAFYQNYIHLYSNVEQFADHARQIYRTNMLWKCGRFIPEKTLLIHRLLLPQTCFSSLVYYTYWFWLLFF